MLEWCLHDSSVVKMVERMEGVMDTFAKGTS